MSPRNSVVLAGLQANEEFRVDWAEVLRIVHKYKMNEAILMHIHSPQRRIGTIEQINAVAALDMHRLEGKLEIWEILLGLLDDKVTDNSNLEEPYSGEVL